MIIQQKYIINLERHLSSLEDNTRIVIGISLSKEHEPKLENIGFPDGSKPGDTILPSPNLGRFCRYNAEGKIIVHRDQQKETAYRTVEWHWQEWHGREKVERSDFRDVSYLRYPRSLLPPTSIELKIEREPNSQLLLISPQYNYVNNNYDQIKMAINIFLEIFGYCEIFTENLKKITSIPTFRVNWEILPPGKYPWEKMQKILDPIISRAKPGNQPIIKNRFQTIEKYGPEFHVIGRGGFRGYVIHGFPHKNVFVLESAYYGNATYIFDQRWEELSKLSKAEIISEAFQKDRVIHLKGWHARIDNILK